MRWFRRKAVRIAAALLAAWTLVGFVVVPRVVHREAVLHRPVIPREVASNPFALALTIRGFSVTEASGAPVLA